VPVATIPVTAGIAMPGDIDESLAILDFMCVVARLR
jgi:hypothetical protein